MKKQKKVYEIKIKEQPSTIQQHAVRNKSRNQICLDYEP